MELGLAVPSGRGPQSSVERRGAEIPLPFRDGGHPTRYGLLIGLEALVVVFVPGGQVSGPLPLFGRSHPKLFFFAGYEYYNQSFEANQQAISSWVPTMAERQGDFSPASLNAELCGPRPDGTANPNAIQSMCDSDNYLPNGTAVTNYNAQPYANSSGAALVNWFPLPNADPFTNPFGYNYIQQIIQTRTASSSRPR